MIAGMEKLLRLSRLRADIALRAVQRAENNLRLQEGRVKEAQQFAHQLKNRINSEREAVREVFVGAPRSRSAVETMLATMQGYEKEEAGAQQKIAEAISARGAARPQLAKARISYAASQRRVEKRKRMLVPLKEQVQRAQELVTETELAESWRGKRGRG